MDAKEYKRLSDKKAPKSPILKNCCFAFLFGGSICVIGQIFIDLYTMWGMEEKNAATTASITLIFLASLLTGLGVFDNIAKIAGAGTLVPITGFSNSIASPAIEFKNEGWIFGMCVKMFSVAGPVIVTGISSSILVGIIYFIVGLF